jgi:hypothetical protein
MGPGRAIRHPASGSQRLRWCYVPQPRWHQGRNERGQEPTRASTFG